VSGERFLDHQARHDFERLLPLRSLQILRHAERSQFGLRGRLAGAELHPPAGHEVQRGDAFGHPGGMVERRRELHDAVAQADLLGPLGGRRQEHLGGRGVRVLLQEVVFDLPHRMEPDPIRQFDLLQGVAEQSLLRALGPRPRQLVLVEQPEPHRTTPPLRSSLRISFRG